MLTAKPNYTEHCFVLAKHRLLKFAGILDDNATPSPTRKEFFRVCCHFISHPGVQMPSRPGITKHIIVVTMGPPKKGGERLEARNVLQAVLLADSFTQKFRPITVEKPKVLLPLVNVPMIEYTLEWLALNKVEEVFSVVYLNIMSDAIMSHAGCPFPAG